MVADTDLLPGSASWSRLALRAKLLATLTLVWLGIEGTVGVVAGMLARRIDRARRLRPRQRDRGAGKHYRHLAEPIRNAWRYPARPSASLPSRPRIEAAAEIFRALGDPERLRLLLRLAEKRGVCVSELAQDEGVKITTVSARLKTLAGMRLVRRRREEKHVFYALADEHVL